MEKQIIIDTVRSAHNVGSIFRTADGAGVTHIYMYGYTPQPIDRFGRVQPEIAKTSLGASATVPWSVVAEVEVPTLAASLKAEGFTLVAVEQVLGAVSLPDFIEPEKVVYILGNEVTGVSPEWLQVADVVVEIPMQGMKESLNVSVCAGIVLFR